MERSISFRSFVSNSMLTLLTVGMCGCFQQYYQTNTTYKVDAAVIEHLDSGNRYFILHTPFDVYALNNIHVNGEIMFFEMDSLKKEYYKYLRPKLNVANRFPLKDSAIVLSEVNLYTNDSLAGYGSANLRIAEITRMDIYGMDARTARKNNKRRDVSLSFCAFCVSFRNE